MSNFDFIAWSLVVSGIAAIGMIGAPRLIQMVAGKPVYHPPKSAAAVVLAMALLLGPLFMRLISDRLLDLPPPRWSMLVLGPVLLLTGLSHLIQIRATDLDQTPSAATAYILFGFGLLIFAMNLYDYLYTART